MKQLSDFLDRNMLPAAIAFGMAVALCLEFALPPDSSFAAGLTAFAKDFQPAILSVILFLQFVKISPHDLHLRRWHIILLAFQLSLFIGLALLCLDFADGSRARILTESAMLCFICPTAAAAGVVTDKLGGKLSDTVTYIVLINFVAALAIPIIVPLVNPSAGITFHSGFYSICRKTFPMLVFPCLAAWTVRYCLRPLQRRLMRHVGWAFYLWGISLSMNIFLATSALLKSRTPILTVALICLTALAACLLQFLVGRLSARRNGTTDSITAGQALGQKNSGFLIWVGYSFLTPVTSIAGGFYSIFQNLFNTWEIRHRREAR